MESLRLEAQRSGRRSTADTPPLARLRSYRRTHSENARAASFEFTSAVQPQAGPSIEVIEKLQSDLAHLQNVMLVVATAVSAMAGCHHLVPGSRTPRQLDRPVSLKRPGTAAAPDTRKSQDRVSEDALSMGRRGLMGEAGVAGVDSAAGDAGLAGHSDMGTAADQTILDNTVQGLKGLVAQGTIRMKMDQVEPDVFSMLVRAGDKSKLGKRPWLDAMQ
jgi:hypothetical protein